MSYIESLRHYDIKGLGDCEFTDDSNLFGDFLIKHKKKREKNACYVQFSALISKGQLVNQVEV